MTGLGLQCQRHSQRGHFAANGWVFLMGHGLSQIAFLCRGEAKSREVPLSFAGWTSPSADIPGLNSPKAGTENGSFENDPQNRRGKKPAPDPRSVLTVMEVNTDGRELIPGNGRSRSYFKVSGSLEGCQCPSSILQAKESDIKSVLLTTSWRYIVAGYG